MGGKDYNMYIDGQWVKNDQTFADFNPASGDVWAEIPDATREDAQKAVAAAAACGWQASAPRLSSCGTTQI